MPFPSQGPANKFRSPVVCLPPCLVVSFLFLCFVLFYFLLILQYKMIFKHADETYCFSMRLMCLVGKKYMLHLGINYRTNKGHSGKTPHLIRLWLGQWMPKALWEEKINPVFPPDPVLMDPLFKAILWTITTVNNENWLHKQIFFSVFKN